MGVEGENGIQRDPPDRDRKTPGRSALICEHCKDRGLEPAGDGGLLPCHVCILRRSEPPKGMFT